MSAGALPLVFAFGERAVCDVVDPSIPAAEVLPAIAFYFAPQAGFAGGLVWVAGDGERELDPLRPIGEQVPAEALIRIAPR